MRRRNISPRHAGSSRRAHTGRNANRPVFFAAFFRFIRVGRFTEGGKPAPGVRLFLSGQSGASSVLVIFMMLVLAALGTFSITSAKVNYTFSRRAADWTAAYYEADAEAEEFLARVDAELAEAERKAYGGLPAANGETANPAPGEAYSRFALENMEALKADYPGLTIEAGRGKITVSANFQSVSRPQTNLAVELSVDAPDYAESGVLTGSGQAGAKARYAITAWTQWQPEIPAEATEQPLWDGKMG